MSMKTIIIAACALGISCASTTERSRVPSTLTSYALLQANGEELEIVTVAGERIARKGPAGLSLLHGSAGANYRTVVAAHQGGTVAFDYRDGSVTWSWPNMRPEWPISIADSEPELVYGSGGMIYVADPSMKVSTLIGAGTMPSWRPGARSVVFESDGSVKLIRDLEKAAEVIAVGTAPVWAPDGRSILYRSESGWAELLDVSTGKRTPLFDATDVITPIRWTPSEDWVYFVRSGGRYWYSIDWFGSEPKQVVLRNLNTGAEVNVFEVYKGNPAQYTWVLADV